MIFTLLLSSSVSVFSQDSCRELYDKFCSKPNPSKDCEEIEMQGNYPKMPEDIIEKLQERKNEILIQARKYQINPRLIASSILSANIIKPLEIGERIQTYLLENGTNTHPNTKYGIGRIGKKKFQSIEKTASSVNNRKERSNEEVKDAIYHNEEDIEYAAALIKKNIGLYSAHGVDISENTPIVVTTYGLESQNSSIGVNKANNKSPQINTWGVVSICVESYVDDILGGDLKTEKSYRSPSTLGHRTDRDGGKGPNPISRPKFYHDPSKQGSHGIGF